MVLRQHQQVNHIPDWTINPVVDATHEHKDSSLHIEKGEISETEEMMDWNNKVVQYNEIG